MTNDFTGSDFEAAGASRTGMSRRQFMAFALQLLALASLPGCRNSTPVLGAQPMTDPFVVEEHCAALLRWAAQGIRDAVLVNVDTHDDFRLVPDARLGDLHELYRRKDWQGFAAAGIPSDRSLYGISNWIYAGARLGVFREVYWVIPFRIFEQPDPAALMRRLLQYCGFSAADFQTFSLADNRFSGTFRGIPITICGLQSLPDIREPLLLSLDVDFFPTYTSEYRVPYLRALHDAFAALYRKRYRIRDLLVCYSVNGDYYLQPHDRWGGDTVVRLLADPGMIDAAPSELLDLLQELENGYRARDGVELIRLTGRFLPRYPEASVLLYNAYGHMLCGEPDRAFDAAMECCRRDRLYVTALPFIGINYLLTGRPREAEPFFRAGVSLDPAMRNGLFQFGTCLRQLGKLREAIVYYRKDVAILGSFPTEFFIADCYLRLGDRQAALASLAAAVKGVEGDPFAHVANPMIAETIDGIIAYCRHNGLNEIAARLQKTPAIIGMYQEFPRH